MDWRQIEAKLGKLFPKVQGDEFKELCTVFAMLKVGPKRERLQKLTGYDVRILNGVIDYVEACWPYAIWSGALSPRYLWRIYPKAKELIEEITGAPLKPDQTGHVPAFVNSRAEPTRGKQKHKKEATPASVLPPPNPKAVFPGREVFEPQEYLELLPEPAKRASRRPAPKSAATAEPCWCGNPTKGHRGKHRSPKVPVVVTMTPGGCQCGNPINGHRGRCRGVRLRPASAELSV